MQILNIIKKYIKDAVKIKTNYKFILWVSEKCTYKNIRYFLSNFYETLS